TRISVSSASETATDTRCTRMMKSATGTGLLERSLRGLGDTRRGRVDLGFEGRCGGCRDEPGRHAIYRGVEFTETLGLQGCDDFRSRACELDRVVHDHRPPRAADRL